jgi:hypothetical protein
VQHPSDAEVLSAIAEFTSLFAAERREVSLDDLITALARLLHVAAQMRDEDVEGHDDDQTLAAGAAEHAHAMTVAGARFPGLALYPSYDLTSDDKEPGLSDPYDDMGDIYRDLLSVTRLAEKGHMMDARWDFRFGFETHWGLHASELLQYLLRFRIA